MQTSPEIRKQNLILYLPLAIISAFLFLLSVNLQAPMNIKIILAFYTALLPFFFLKPEYFLYAVFLISPTIRDISSEEVFYQNGFVSLNLSFIINFSIILFAFLLIFRNRTRISRFINLKPIAAFIFFVTFCFLSFFYSVEQKKTIEESLRLVAIFGIIISSILSVKDKKTFFYLLSSILGGMIFPALVGLKEFLNGEGWYDEALMSNRPQSTFMHPATFAFYLLFALPVIVAMIKDKIEKIPRLALIFLGFSFIGLIFVTMTRGAWAALLVMTLFYGIIKNRKLLLGAVMIGLLLYLSVPEISLRINDSFAPKYNSSLATRLNIYKTTLPAFFDAPLLGNGFGSFEAIHLKYNPEAYSYYSLQAHNDYLRILIELGALGFILYLSIFAFLFFYLLKLYKSSDSILQNYIFSLFILWAGALTISAGDNLLRTMPVQFLIWGYTASIISLAKIERGA